MLSTQRGQRAILLVVFKSKGQTINAVSYCATQKRLQRAIKRRQRGQLSAGEVLLHNNAHPLTAITTYVLLHCLGHLFHPPYNSHFPPSDFTCSHT
jgi:hypothetical protein